MPYMSQPRHRRSQDVSSMTVLPSPQPPGPRAPSQRNTEIATRIAMCLRFAKITEKKRGDKPQAEIE